MKDELTVDYKDILITNNLDEYIALFEENKLNDLSLLIDMTEDDYEKIGIELIGDRKRLKKIFSKEGIKNFYNEYRKAIFQNIKSQKINEKENNKIKKVIKKTNQTKLTYNDFFN
jgi:hypothetical protein